MSYFDLHVIDVAWISSISYALLYFLSHSAISSRQTRPHCPMNLSLAQLVYVCGLPLRLLPPQLRDAPSISSHRLVCGSRDSQERSRFYMPSFTSAFRRASICIHHVRRGTCPTSPYRLVLCFAWPLFHSHDSTLLESGNSRGVCWMQSVSQYHAPYRMTACSCCDRRSHY